MRLELLDRNRWDGKKYWVAVNRIIYKTNDWIITQFYQTRMNNLHHYRMSYQCYRFCDFELSSSLSTREHAGSKNRCQKLSRWCKKLSTSSIKSDRIHSTFDAKLWSNTSKKHSIQVQFMVSLAFRPAEILIFNFVIIANKLNNYLFNHQESLTPLSLCINVQ